MARTIRPPSGKATPRASPSGSRWTQREPLATFARMVALLGISGSLRKTSLNRALLDAIREALPQGAGMTMFDDLEFPIFNDDRDDPPGVVDLKAAIAGSDGVVFAVPEYNYSIPGGLKNALDWVSRPPDRSPMRGKPIGIVGAASGMSGTIRAQTHMRQM